MAMPDRGRPDDECLAPRHGWAAADGSARYDTTVMPAGAHMRAILARLGGDFPVVGSRRGLATDVEHTLAPPAGLRSALIPRILVGLRGLHPAECTTDRELPADIATTAALDGCTRAPTMRLPLLALLTALLPVGALAATLTPATIPLFVRNPYLSTWLQNARSEPWTRWPIFWTGQEMGFAVLFRVGGNVYPLLGRPQDSLGGEDDGYSVRYPVWRGVDYDASKTWLKYWIGGEGGGGAGSGTGVEVTLTFTSPVTVNDTMRQSIPAGYLAVDVAGDIDCEVYVDVNGLWVTGDRGSHIKWSMSEHGNLRSWKVTRSREEHFTEKWDRAEWGSLFFTAPKDTRYESNVSGRLRRRFAQGASLRNTSDNRFRNVMDAEPVFAFAHAFRLTHNSTSTGSALFTLAHIQDEVAQFASARGLTAMRPLWRGYFDDHHDVLHFHFYDYQHASAEADKFSAQLIDHASRAMSGPAAHTYTDILLLSARQVLGGTSFSGTPSRPLLFLKEISSDGNMQTIDVIFPAFPFFLYVNPAWLRYLLEPLLEHQSAGLYPNAYSMHDLGSSFPNATGHPDGRDEYMPVEECGNMLIMGAAVVGSIIEENGGGEAARQMAREWLEGGWGDGGPPRGRYALWKQWTGYLIEFGLLPATQLSTDDFAGRLANQTNLALKGILGIKAMAELAGVVGNDKDEKHFSDVADEYIKTWHSLALTRDKTHTKLAYHWQGSWGTLYNLYADSLLCYRRGLTSPLTQYSTLRRPASPRAKEQDPLGGGSSSGFVPEDIYSKQSKWYMTVEQKYGLPLDSRHLYTKSDWEFFAAAVSARKTREMIITDVGRWVNETSTDRPFTDLYDTEGDGGFPGITFMARPVVGGHFAVLALERACGGRGLRGLEYPGDVWGLRGGAEEGGQMRGARSPLFAKRIAKLLIEVGDRTRAPRNVRRRRVRSQIEGPSVVGNLHRKLNSATGTPHHDPERIILPFFKFRECAVSGLRESNGSIGVGAGPPGYRTITQPDAGPVVRIPEGKVANPIRFVTAVPLGCLRFQRSAGKVAPESSSYIATSTPFKPQVRSGIDESGATTASAPNGFKNAFPDAGSQGCLTRYGELLVRLTYTFPVESTTFNVKKPGPPPFA
ncbi:hypothetical protein Dda_6403 [Drechslerella dactyloides]|uniref:Glutaminase A n=1 Tax=Drechslerella dactyloides TaxID=74499 RepID=A0AAD6ITG0_DREDA|nr:hypothetical protein Dda_6403 [Drechslerella dactyloides]